MGDESRSVRLFRGLPADPGTRRRLLARLGWGVLIGVVAGAIIAALTALALAANPSGWSWQTPLSIVGFVGGWALAGGGIALVASAGAIVALLLYTASGGSEHRASAAALGAGGVLLLAGWGVDQMFSAYPFAIYIAIPASLVGAIVAALVVSRATSRV